MKQIDVFGSCWGFQCVSRFTVRTVLLRDGGSVKNSCWRSIFCGVFNGGLPSHHTFQLLQSDFEDLVTILRHFHMGWSWFSLLASWGIGLSKLKCSIKWAGTAPHLPPPHHMHISVWNTQKNGPTTWTCIDRCTWLVPRGWRSPQMHTYVFTLFFCTCVHTDILHDYVCVHISACGYADAHVCLYICAYVRAYTVCVSINGGARENHAIDWLWLFADRCWP